MKAEGGRMKPTIHPPAFFVGKGVSMHERELEAALDAARRAGELILDHYERFEVIPDARADITTAADREAQEVILQTLQASFPDDAYCAEEKTPSLQGRATTGSRLWIIDPIDGTKGFARKNGEFSVMIAFVEDGQIGAGVVLEPAPGRLTYALRGGGCFRHEPGGGPVPCLVSTCADLPSSRLTESRSRNPHEASWQVRALGPAHVVETYSAGIKLALVARGEVDLYANVYTSFHDWDICAGQILVTEAGGRVTGLAGEELRYGLPGAWQRQGMLATNGLLHDAAVEALRKGKR
jgi:3'(2'), 5'-bisphosphate nucleotidase